MARAAALHPGGAGRRAGARLLAGRSRPSSPRTPTAAASTGPRARRSSSASWPGSSRSARCALGAARTRDRADARGAPLARRRGPRRAPPRLRAEGRLQQPPALRGARALARRRRSSRRRRARGALEAAPGSTLLEEAGRAAVLRGRRLHPAVAQLPARRAAGVPVGHRAHRVARAARSRPPWLRRARAVARLPRSPTRTPRTGGSRTTARTTGRCPCILSVLRLLGLPPHTPGGEPRRARRAALPARAVGRGGGLAARAARARRPAAAAAARRRSPSPDAATTCCAAATRRRSPTFRCGTLRDRFSQIDMLHLDVWWRGQNVLVDGGSYLYNGPAAWHEHFMGTAATTRVARRRPRPDAPLPPLQDPLLDQARLLRFEDARGARPVRGRAPRAIAATRAAASTAARCCFVQGRPLGGGGHGAGATGDARGATALARRPYPRRPGRRRPAGSRSRRRRGPSP